MLSILNTLCHGYVAIPVIQVCRKRRLLARWGVGKGIRFSTIARRSSANPGYLRIALSMLETLGWINRDDDTYRLNREIDFDVIPEDILDLYQVAPEEMFGDTSVQVKLGQWLRELRNRRADSVDIVRLVEGALLLPILIALRQVAVPRQTLLPQNMDSELRRELCGLFVAKGWGHQTGDAFSLSSTGKELIERAYVMAIAVSYRPMLARMEELLFGNSATVFERGDSAGESHIDRQLNVIASGFQHQRYFKDAEHHLLSIFHELPLAEQPRYIADIGCGDGTFLKHLYEAICAKTKRGQSLTQYPLLVIGVDYNQAALIETERTLKEVPRLTFTGDISNPQQIVSDLKKHGIVDSENTLYLRSFLDHNFRYKAAQRARQDFTDEFPLIPGNHYIDGKGRAVDRTQVLKAWRAHLHRWAAIANRHGLVVLESHCLPPSLSKRYFERTESFYFDAVHALSGQYLIDSEIFFALAASVGLFPIEPPVRYPKTLPFCRITLSHLEKRDYVVRHAQLRDLDGLLDMEKQCWAPELQTPRSEILRRLKVYPQGQFVLELDGRVVGVIYSQRIENEEVLKGATVDLVGRFHRDNGPIVQLLALNVLPAFQGRNLGDQLLNFMLYRCSVVNGVEKVVGVTVCKDHASRESGASFIEYVRSRDEHGLLLDSNLRFHEFHGATIGEVIEGYRPKDVLNETRGILIHYDIYNLMHRARFGAETSAAKLDPRQRLEIDGDLRHFVETSIRRCLGERKVSAYAPDRPLMEMGLDSADLLELNELLSSRLNISLEPAFFFEHNTCNRIVGSLGSRIAGGFDAVANLPLSNGDPQESEVDGEGERDGVAIIGVATRLPGGISTIGDFWKLLKDERNAIGRLPDGRWQWSADIDPLTRHAGIDRGGFLERIDAFDAGFFRISPREAELMDPQQRILLELASQTIEDAGYSPESLADTKTGVFIGASGSDYLRLLDNSTVPVDAHFGTGNSMAILANRLSYFFDLNGPSLQIDTACSSSLVALHYAMQSLRTGESSQALVGGIHLMCHPANTIAYYNAGMLSHTGACRTFDAQADGYVRSEGAVMILIKPLKAAEFDGDPIYAVIRGTAINHGGQASGLTVPNPEKQAKLLQAAWEAAGVSPSTISYIEMHGTGTPLGDPIEVDGIKRAFSRAEFNGSTCGLGSVKTNLGHLEAAAGLAGLLKVVLCLRHRELSATVHLTEINRHIHLENSPLYVVRECQDWPKPPSSDRRRAGISSFGFGGANAHAVLEEHLCRPRRVTDGTVNTRCPYLFVLSAKTAERLRAYANRYLQWLSNADFEISMEDLTYTLQVGRQAMDSRLALVAEDKEDLAAKLKLFCNRSKTAESYFHNTIRFDSAISSSPDTNGRDTDVAIALDKRNLAAIAKLWTSGVSIPWKVLHRDRRPHRIQLLTYPFAPISHWFKPHDSQGVRPRTQDLILHPLVQRNTSDALQHRFTSTFSGQEFFLGDHMVDGCRTLPGAAMIEMVRNAYEIATGAKITGASGLQFSSVIWAQPVRVGARPRTVHIKLSLNGGDCIRYEIYSDSEVSPERKIVHGQGTVVARGFDSIPRLDLLRLQAQTSTRRLGSDEFYNHFGEEGIGYGPGHQGVSEMFLDVDQALARISLPSSVAATARDYVLHPSIVDSALQVGIALQTVGNPRKGNPVLPFSVESIEVFAGTRDSMWAWVRYGDKEGRSTGQLRSVDIDLCDESGNACMRFKKLSARRAHGNRVTPGKEDVNILSEPHASSSAPMMIKPVWTPYRPLVTPPSRISSLRALVFGADKRVMPAVKKAFPNSTFAEITADWTEPAVVESLEEYGEIDQIVWFAAGLLDESIADQRIIDRQRNGVLGLFNLIKALIHQGYGAREMVWTICTTQTLAVRINDHVDPTNASIHGLIGSMAKEFPNWRVRLIDLESEWSEALSSLFYLPTAASLNPMAYRRGQWFRREFIPVRELSIRQHLLRRNGIYVVVGGAGGIGKEWSRWLIERYQAQLIWIGRRDKDNSIQKQIDDLEAFGPAPYYISADATDQESLQAAYDEIKRRFSKINGVVHSAIVLKDSSLSNMTLEHFTSSLEANVDVCVRIAQVFSPETLDFLLFFSSIQSFCTFGGQSNYAAGCTFKDAFADRLRQDCSYAVKVVNWGYWGSVGVVANDYYRESMALKGFGSIEPEEGFELLERLINGPMDQLAILKTVRSGVIDGLLEDEWLTADARNVASVDAEHEPWLPQIPQLQATFDDGGLSLPGLMPILGKLLWAIVQAFGFCGRDQRSISAIKDAIDGRRRYERWVEETLLILERLNHLHIDGDTCVATDPTLLRMEDGWNEWNDHKERYLFNPDTRSQVVLLDQCLRNLQEILAGKVLATDVIFADSSAELAAGIYKNNPIADYFNNALATTVRAYIEERIKADNSFRCRILEIGAGTGGTTTAMAPILAPLKDQILEYCFTDISAAFLTSAREQFGQEWPNFVTRRFDVEKPLGEQSICIAGYDVVIAANVLHATHDIRITLRNAKAALRREGLLVLNELSANSLFLHLTFGLLRGWWLYEDSELRIPGCPALTPDTWRDVLENEGFRSVAFPAANAHAFGQQVIVAQSNGVIRQRLSVSSTIQPSSEVKRPAPSDADSSVSGSKADNLSAFQNVGALEDIPDQMIENRVKTIVRQSIATNLKMDEGEIQDGRVFSDYGVDSIIGVRLVNQINQHCNILLPVTTLFDYNNVNELSVFITRQFRIVLISSLFNGPVNRGVPADKPPTMDPGPPVAFAPGEMFSRRVVIARPGEVSDIEIRESPLPLLAAHEVRVAVRGCSLNFADLLCVKGLYPNMPAYPFTPGIEASGVVVAVGTSVHSVRVGESVLVFMGKNMGGHASVITCSEDCVLKKPEGLSFEEACSLLAVGITMVYAFRKAQLRKGETILIQTAAGGTGLVAVQLAQYHGGEIYATAGSSEKLDYLRQLGVPHTLNYRQTDFAAEIKRLTHGRGVDAVINTLHGDAIQKGMNCLAAGGRYIEVAMTALKSAKAIDLSVLNSNQSFHSIDLIRLASEERQTFIACYEEMIELVSRGVLRPTVGHILPFDRIKEAYEYLEDRRSIGKVVISVPEAMTREQEMPVGVTSRERSTGGPALSGVREPIAIVGMSGRFAKSPTLADLWKHLANGDDLVDEVKRWDLRRAYAEDFQEAENSCYAGGLLQDIDKFDPAFFDISALEATHMDPQQRLFLEEAWKALEDAGHAGVSTEGRRCGVYVGCTSGDYYRLMPKHSPAHSFWGNAGSVIPARIAYYLNLRGPAIAIDTACSSSLVAIHMACEALRTRETEFALAGGVFLLSTADFYLSANKAGMLSARGRCHTFDARADGFVPGEGVGVLVLKRLNDAVAHGDHVYGVIRGSGLNQDGKTNGLTAPSANSQQQLERQVYESFSIHPERIQMLEAHGTGTKLGDPIEFEALTQAFRKDTQRKEFCAIGSIKSNLGHTATAAGVAGVLKVLLSLEHKQIPPTLHFTSGNPSIQFADSPFYVNTELKEWSAPDGNARCAAVSSFGFSGTNAHMVIEEPPHVERSHRGRPAFLIVLSARTSDQLRRQVEQLTDFCEQHPNVDIGNISYTLLVGRRHFNHRLTTIVQDGRELIGYLRKWLETGRVLPVQVSEILEGEHREDLSLREFGNECLQVCNRTTDTNAYLTKLATVSTLFAQGYNLEFSELFSRDGYSKLSLPTYPFSRERYWVTPEASPSAMKATHSARYSSAPIHPMVQQNCSTLGAQVYRSDFSGDEFFLVDHQLHGKRLMPAVAYLEMAVAAATHALSNGDSPIGIRLKNVVWSTPLTVGEKTDAVVIRLLPKSGTTIDFEIASDTGQGESQRLVYCQGTLDIRGLETAPTIDLASIKNVTTSGIGAQECYDAFQEMGVTYGPAHRGLESISFSKELAIAKLSLPAVTASTAQDYFLHPSVMDASLQATALFAPSRLRGTQHDADVSARLQLPYAVEEVTVHHPSELHMWAVLRFSKGADIDRRVTKLDIDVCNEEGMICVGLKGLTLRDIERDAQPLAGAAAGRCLFFQPRLEPKPTMAQAAPPGYVQRSAILCNVPVDEDALRLDGTHVHSLHAAGDPRIDEYFRTCVAKALQLIQDLLQARTTGKKLLQILIAGRKSERSDELQALRALAALVKTIRQEDPAIVAQLIEVEASETESSILEKIADNSTCPQDAVVIYRNSQRHVAGWKEIASLPVDQASPWKAKGIYLVTGGAGGLGQLFVREICKCVGGATVVVAGRSDLSGHDLAKLEVLVAFGATVHYRQADVSRKESVDALINWIRTDIGELNGVLHCAGTVRDSLSLHKTEHEVNEVLAPKVAGLVHLDLATQDMALDFFICFSSVAGTLGNVGQIDYAAANAFMDAFAHYRAGLVAAGKRQGRSLSINWPLWQVSGIQVTEETADRLFRDFGMTAMPSTTGIQAFYQCYASACPQVMVINGNEKQIRQAIEKGLVRTAETTGGSHRSFESGEPASTVSSKSLRERATNYLRQVIASVLEFPVQRVKDTDPFERFGIDSILALKLINELEKTFGSLSKILFFEHQNIRSLVDFIVGNYSARLIEVLGPDNQSGNPTPAEPAAVAPSEEGKSGFALVRSSVVSSNALAPSKLDTLGRVESTEALDIAIIGLSGRYPGARTVAEFWENLKLGRDCISEIPSDRWDYRRHFSTDRNKPGTTYSKWGGFIDGVDEFDPLFFNISPREAEMMDPQERLFLQCAWETIEDAGYVPSALGGANASGMAANVGVFVGVMYEEYQFFGVEETLNGRPIALSGNPSAIANRVSYACNFSGPCMVVDTMCSSSLTAIHLACQSLYLGECVTAIAGGVNVSIHPNKYLLLSQGRFASSVGRCESFGRGGDGYVPGEGVGAVLLKPLSTAVRDGDHIYGIIRGTAVNHGGKTNGFTVPNPNAQAAMISRAIDQAGVDPRVISYVEAHGTGTSLGDPIEIAGLTQAFREKTQDRQYCAIGSLKSNIGHCESAAGIGGVTKVLVQLKHKQLVPSLHAQTLNPLIDFSETPFRVQQQLGDWTQPTVMSDGEIQKAPRIAGISSFGAGGSNAHIVVQESPDSENVLSERTQSMPGQAVIIVLSAKTEERLAAAVTNLYRHLKATHPDSDGSSLRNVAYTLQVGRVAMEERLAFVVASQRQLEEKLEGILHSRTDSPDVFCGSINHTDKIVALIQEDGGLDKVIAEWIKEGKLDRLARMWASGVHIQWNSLYDLSKHQRVSLPTYPFARERYWVPAAAKASDKDASYEIVQTTPGHGFDRLILTKDWKSSELPDSGTERAGVVFLLGTAQTTALAGKLFAEKAAIQVVEVVQEWPSVPSSAISTDFYSATAGESLYRRLENATSNKRLLGVVDCTALDANYGQQPAQEVGKVRFIQTLIEHEAKHGFKLLQLVSRLNPFRTSTTTLRGARLAGLYRMINAEYRKVQSVVMDVDLGVSSYPELAALIQGEFLNHDDGTGECCYRQGVRYEPYLVATGCSENQPGGALTRVAWDDVFLITGGTRGIGAAVAKHLMTRGARRLVLFGREQLPARVEWESIVKANTPPDLARKLGFLLSMINTGVQVRYFNTALTDSTGLQEMLRQVHLELGPITGVFHCAGSSGENPAFIKKSIDEIETVCEPKVQGVIELHRVLRNEPLRFFVLFSSASSAIPSLSAGLSDYTMANAFMDFYALHQASQGQTIFKSIQWPAWGETGMAVGKMETPSYARTGLTPMTTADGMHFLEVVLNSSWTVAMPAVMKPVKFDYADLLSTKFGDIAPRQEAGKENSFVASAASQVTSSDARRASIVKWLREILMSELKLSADHFRETRRFDEYGVDSVMIAQLVQTMQQRIRGTLPPSLLLEYASVGALADYFASAHPDDFADLSANTTFDQDAAIPASDHRSLHHSDGSAELRKSESRVSEPRDRDVKPRRDGSTTDIAVVGISCRFPGASSKAAYWNQLAAGQSALRRIPHLRWQSEDDRLLHGGWLEDIDCFDPGYFNLSESDAAIMDPQARLLLEQSLFALCDAGYDLQKILGTRAGVYIGGRSQMSIDMNAVLKAPNPILGVNQNYLATNISRFFNFSGPSVVVDTGCSSAITSMLFASDALRSTRIDMAMVGAVSLLLTPDAHRLFAGRNILSESGDFRIFDRRATGEVLGEGAGVLLLRRLQDAIADGNQIYGVINAISMNNDGRTLGPGSPNIHAQKQVMIDALQSTGVSPEDVRYIEVNGGGSPVVDAVEIKALSEVYRLDDQNLQPCFLGSVKPNVGHLLLASGLAGFVRCVLSVYRRRIPPFLSAMEPFEYYDFSASRIRFNRDTVDWQVAPGGRRIAAQNSYPDGGTNGHVLIEEFIPDDSYHQQLFPKPEPLLNRSRFSVPVPTLPSSVASATPMRKEETVCVGMRNFLAEFEETNSKGEATRKSEEVFNGNGSIRTAWGEYDEKSI